ncbi:serine protease [Sorangium sp. So ce327]|uniref:trypsin-like peptidase domain-containing protein n=1 Tax=Sorangium sp. So ce327 TaxID=3133301 RepID=UPI003F6433CD
MIIRQTEYLSGRTLAALLEAMRAVVRIGVRIGTSSGMLEFFASGFLLTPQLVLTAGYVVDPTNPHFDGKRITEMSVDLMTVGDPSRSFRIRAVLEYFGSRDDDVAMLRLSEPVEVRPLKPTSASAVEITRSEWVFLLSCPHGHLEVMASFGQLKEGDQGALLYEVSLDPGSIGGPIITTRGEILGMHLISRHLLGVPEQSINRGVSIDAFLADLSERRPDLWDEVRRYHGLQTSHDVRTKIDDEQAARRGDEAARQAYLRSAAVLWSFEPGALVPFPRQHHGRTARSLLLDDVVSVRQGDGTSRWALKSGVRAEALRDLGSLERLREARRQNAVESTGAQALLDRLLEGGSGVDPARMTTQELEWLRTLAESLRPFVPGLPTAEDLDRRLSSRRILDPFGRLAGLHFRGRRRELAQLAQHLDAGADAPAVLLIHGPGGSGKSALTARLILDRCVGVDGAVRVPFAYLDFDRAILESRKPASLYAEILRQIALVAPGGAVAGANPIASRELSSPDALREAAADVAAAIDEACRRLGDTPFLLVLDSFEEVQFRAGGPQGTPTQWLDALVQATARVRVVILGRAPAGELEVAGKRARELALGPLDDEAAQGMLESLGVTDPRAVAQLVAVARGVPLTLSVGATFLARHGAAELEEALRKVSERLVQAVLYDRVLERLHDARICKLARPGLVLRRVTVPLLREILAPIAEVEASTEEQVRDLFEALRKEVFLAYSEQPDVLVHRPELRRITLDLIEQNDPELVRRVDAAAAEFYRRQPGPEARAEELYHRLRLGEPAEVLDGLWVPGVGEALRLDPEERLPDRSREWLDEKGHGRLLAFMDAAPLQAVDPVRRVRERVWATAGSEDAPWFLSIVLSDREADAIQALGADQRPLAAFRAKQAAARATALGVAAEVLRARLMQAMIAELGEGARAVWERLAQALSINVPLGEPYETALLAYWLEKGGALQRYDLDTGRRSILRDEEALRADPDLARYVYAVLCRIEASAQPIRRALEVLGLGSHSELEIESDAEALALGTRERGSVNLMARALGVDASGSTRDTWLAVLKAAYHREDANLILASLVAKDFELGDVIADLWLRRGGAVIHERLFAALGRWERASLSKASALFAEDHLDQIGAALDQLAAAKPGAATELRQAVRSQEHTIPRLPELSGAGPQLRSDLRVLAADAPGPLGSWLRAALMLARSSAPAATPTFERALQTLGLVP